MKKINIDISSELQKIKKKMILVFCIAGIMLVIGVVLVALILNNSEKSKIENSEWDWDLLSAKYRGDTFQNFDDKYRVEKVKNSNTETDSEFSLLKANMDDGSVRLDEATYNNLKTKEGRVKTGTDKDKMVAPGIIWYENKPSTYDDNYK